MECHKFEKLIALYVEGDLDDREARKVEAHLGVCRSCQTFAEEMKESQGELKSLRLLEIEPELLGSVRQAVLSEVLSSPDVFERKRFWRFPQLRWQYALAMITILFVTVGLALFLKTHEPARPKQLTHSQPSVQPHSPSPMPTERPLPQSQLAKAQRLTSSLKRPSRNQAKGTDDLRVTQQTASIQPVEPRRVETRGPETEPSENQIVIKLETDDPNVVIYWIIENRGGKAL